MISGWKRETTVREYSKSGIRGDVIYYAPCGKKFKFLASKNKHECEAKAKTEPSGSPPVPDVAQVGSVEPHWE